MKKYINIVKKSAGTFVPPCPAGVDILFFIVEEESKSISLSPQLTPTVSFKLMKNSYLNKPYTPCKETKVEDTYYIGLYFLDVLP